MTAATVRSFECFMAAFIPVSCGDDLEADAPEHFSADTVTGHRVHRNSLFKRVSSFLIPADGRKNVIAVARRRGRRMDNLRSLFSSNAASWICLRACSQPNTRYAQTGPAPWVASSRSIRILAHTIHWNVFAGWIAHATAGVRGRSLFCCLGNCAAFAKLVRPSEEFVVK